jgi:energy-converting hydrogenase A subunit R
LARKRDTLSRQFVTDCEGPVSLNDNAMEMAAEFIPNGASFFGKISRYDDYLVDIVHKPGYKAGDTLRLIVPFFKAYGVTNKMMEEYSRENILFVPGAEATLSKALSEMEVFIISRSYHPYIHGLCEEAGFPIENTYSTEIDIDQYGLSEEDGKTIRAIREEIDALPEFDLPHEAKHFDELPEDSRRTIKFLQHVFWEELPKMNAGHLLTSINPIGGTEKARALEDSLLRTGKELSQVMYVGDSITDVQAFKEVKKGGGLAVSFNGNRYAIDAAEIALYGENTKIITLVADAFAAGGRSEVYRLLGKIDTHIMEEIKARGAVIIDEADKEKTVRESQAMRKEIRGIAGHLG